MSFSFFPIKVKHIISRKFIKDSDNFKSQNELKKVNEILKKIGYIHENVVYIGFQGIALNHGQIHACYNYDFIQKQWWVAIVV